ncbi:MAG: hypothetical protein FD161_943 [Limisphaerales bacterium]|nr:MAG: hypothetical protein FD161_943 [Limisphaerales bacterium]KAG0509925.1 MAG: hypothetical protein E1N63_943 [Limisphaerales bacterium]TXT50604.1 MAG: hypothetical protein FD140_2236 [Limisphaerales bacterium]
MNATAPIVPPGLPLPDAYDLELTRRMDELLTQHAGELAKLGWLARRRRERELRRWVESELSCLVRAGKLPPKRDKDRLMRSLLGSEPPIIHWAAHQGPRGHRRLG